MPRQPTAQRQEQGREFSCSFVRRFDEAADIGDVHRQWSFLLPTQHAIVTMVIDHRFLVDTSKLLVRCKRRIIRLPKLCRIHFGEGSSKRNTNACSLELRCDLMVAASLAHSGAVAGTALLRSRWPHDLSLR